MLITVIAYYPPAQAENVGTKFIEVMSRYPDDPTVSEAILHGAVSATAEGLRVIGVLAVKDGKVREAMDLETRRMLAFARDIEGFRYSIDVAYDVMEAMQAIDMKSPV